MNAVFEPSLLFITESDWQNEETKDAFLEHLSDNLDVLDEFDICQVYWTDEFEHLLWETPQMHPWFAYSKNQLIPILYQKLHSRTNHDFFCHEKPSIVEPDFKHTINQHDIHEYFLKLISTLLEFKTNFYLCVGVQNQLNSPEKYQFFIESDEPKFTPELINQAGDWIKYVDVIAKFFPKNSTEFDEKFEKGLDFIRQRDFEKKAYLFDFQFTKNFIKSIIHRNTLQEEILKAIVQKLVSTTQESSQSNLHDEFLSKTKQHRIRVTQRPSSTRIHYKILDNNSIQFLQYYGEGEHDKGL